MSIQTHRILGATFNAICSVLNHLYSPKGYPRYLTVVNISQDSVGVGFRFVKELLQRTEFDALEILGSLSLNIIVR